MRHPLVRFLLFMVIGLITPFIGETQFSVFIRGDVENLIGSVVFNTIFLIPSFGIVCLVRWLIRDRRIALGVLTVIFGTIGLMVEWFLIGNSPWGNPDAHQPAMFAFWACMIVVPVVLIEPDARLARLKRVVLIVGAAYTIMAVLGQILLPSADAQFVFHIWTFIYGYMGMLALCLGGYMWKLSGSVPVPASQPE